MLFALAGCARAPQRAAERVAILPFENLTGDTSLDWIRTAGPAILAEQVAGSTRLFPAQAPSRSEALIGGANRFLYCSVSRDRKGTGQALHFDFTIEDAATHKIVASGVADGAVLFAMNTLARALEPAARPFSSADPDAVATWGRGEFEHAIALDADFGTAWVSFIEQLARSGKPEDAALAADKALSRATLRSPLDKARIQLLAAELRKDGPARVAALTSLAALVPTDTGTLMALADAEQKQRDYASSAAAYRRVLAMEPANANAMNGLGYAEGEAGHVDAAVQALELYGRQPNQAINALDSLGEIHFMNGRFAEAEKYFSQVTARAPDFQGGAALMKAAYARWLSSGGDMTAADALMRRYLDARAAQKDPTALWREAMWLYSTGRPQAAVAKLASAPADQTALQKATIQRQLAVWSGEVKPPTDLAQIKAIYDSTNPAADGLIRTIYAAALVGAGKTEDARALLKRWPLPESAGDPFLQSLVFPEFLELRRKLGLQ